MTKAQRNILRVKRSPNYRGISQDMQHYMDTGAQANWRAVFQPLITGLVINRGTQMAADLGYTFDVQNLYARDWFNDYLLTFAQEINQTTKLNVAGVVAHGQAVGASIGEMQGRISNMFEYYLEGGSLTEEEIEWYTSRLPSHRTENIARTETIRASNAGSHEIHKQWGVKFKEWIATFDDRVRPAHREAGRRYIEGGEGGPIPIDQPFIVMGQAMQYPGDPAGSPANFCNCRCTTAPWLPKVLDGEPGVPEPAVDVPEPLPQPPVPQPQAPTGPPGPVGPKVSEALKGPKTGPNAKKYRVALDAIDDVHGDGDLPEIPLKTKKSRNFHGQFRSRGSFGSDKGTPYDVLINPDSDHGSFTTCHEIGHFLDMAQLGDEGYFGSAGWDAFSSEMGGFGSSVRRSDAMRTIVDMVNDPKAYAADVGTMGMTEPSKRYLQYLAGDEELWARAYAQYITVKSQDPILLAQLDALRADSMYGSVIQWSDKDFEPILAEIDKLFKNKGWIR